MGFSPEMPHSAAGWRIEPPVSVPVAAAQSAAQALLEQRVLWRTVWGVLVYVALVLGIGWRVSRGTKSAEGHLRDDAPVDQILFELHGLILSLHHDARFLRSQGALDHARRGLERVIAPDLTDAGREACAAPRPTRRATKAR